MSNCDKMRNVLGEGVRMELSYQDPDGVSIETIQVIWDDNVISPVSMILNNGIWRMQMESNEKKYLYRFLINNSISVNDPYANMYGSDCDGTLWSVYFENEENQRLYNSTQYYLEIKELLLSDTVKDIIVPQRDNRFFPIADKMTAICVKISDGTGLHTLTMLFINPNHEIIDLAEQTVDLDMKEEDDIIVWFYRNIDQKRKDFMYGTWTYLLLVDGQYWLQGQYDIESIQRFSVQI